MKHRNNKGQFVSKRVIRGRLLFIVLGVIGIVAGVDQANSMENTKVIISQPAAQTEVSEPPVMQVRTRPLDEIEEMELWEAKQVVEVIEWNNDYGIVSDYFENNTDLTTEEIRIFECIAGKENSTHELLRESGGSVVHCHNGNEWVSHVGGCWSGERQGKTEYATGIFQILPTSWNGYRCEGSYESWEDQADCAVKILRNANRGWYEWSTASKCI